MHYGLEYTSFFLQHADSVGSYHNTAVARPIRHHGTHLVKRITQHTHTHRMPLRLSASPPHLEEKVLHAQRRAGGVLVGRRQVGVRGHRLGARPHGFGAVRGAGLAPGRGGVAAGVLGVLADVEGEERGRGDGEEEEHEEAGKEAGR